MSKSLDRILVPRLALATLGLSLLVGFAVGASQGIKAGGIATLITWALVGGIETTIFLLLDKAERREDRDALPRQFTQTEIKKIQKRRNCEPSPPAYPEGRADAPSGSAEA